MSVASPRSVTVGPEWPGHFVVQIMMNESTKGWSSEDRHVRMVIVKRWDILMRHTVPFRTSARWRSSFSRCCSAPLYLQSR